VHHILVLMAILKNRMILNWITLALELIPNLTEYVVQIVNFYHFIVIYLVYLMIFFGLRIHFKTSNVFYPIFIILLSH